MARKFALFCGIFLLAAPCPAAPRYGVTDLGTGTASAINNHGQVVGTSNLSYQISHALLWQKGTMQELGPAMSQADSINDKGQVVGMCQSRAVMWQAGQMTELGALPPPSADFEPAIQSGATSINNAGQIAGYSVFRQRKGLLNYAQRVDYPYAFLWQRGRMTSLGLQNNALAAVLNKAGKIDFLVSVHGPDGSSLDGVTGINDQNQVIGGLDLGLVTKSGRDMKVHAFLSVNGMAKDLGTLGGQDSAPKAVDNSGDVVGSSGTASHRAYGRYVDDPIHAFIWRNGTMWDLNRLLPARSGWILLSANGINDRGQIVGDGLYQNRHHAFLLTPIPL